MIRRRRRSNLTRLHESNYIKLLLVVPLIDNVEKDVRIDSKSNHCIEINILEKTPYTSVLSLRLKHKTLSRWIPDLSMTIRSYHDARVAEVLTFQQHRQFQANYSYPNENMYHTNEKQQINLFLNEWLSHCVAARLIFNGKIEFLNA